MTRSRNRISTQEIALLALLTTLALMFSYIESLLPAPGPPGVKLGIANIVIVLILFRMSATEAAAVNLLRVLLAGLLFTGLSGALYSAAGAFLSLAGMILLKKTRKFSMVGVSMAGGVLHNLGQLIGVYFMISHSFLAYVPVLIISGILMGLITGSLLYLLLPALHHSFRIGQKGGA